MVVRLFGVRLFEFSSRKMLLVFEILLVFEVVVLKKKLRADTRLLSIP